MTWTLKEFEELQARRRLKIKESKPAGGCRQLRKQYRSKTEEDFAKSGYREVTDEEILEVKYEPLRLYLPGGSYKIDFVIVTRDALLLVEVKGSNRQKNYRDGRSKLRAAAAVWGQVRFFRFFQATKEHGQWRIEEIR